MRIVYCLIQCDQLSGGVRILFEHANRLALRGHEVEIWSLTPFEERLLPFPAHVPIRYVSCEYDQEKQKVLKLMWRETGAKEPDIFVAGSYPVAYAAASVPNARPFWYLQHDEAFVVSHDAALLKTCTDAMALPISLISNSRWTMETIKEKYGAVSALVTYGIDGRLFHPAQDRPILDFGDPCAVFIIDQQYWKGMNDMFLALSRVADKIRNLRIVGICSQAPQGFSVRRDVTLFVNPPQEDLARIYSSANVFVSSSWSEGFGLPGLEAMACDVPVVTTDSGGVREYARDRVNCLMTKPRDHQALANAVIEVLGDGALRHKLAENGLKTVKEFDWEKRMDALEAIFNRRQ